MFNEVYTLGPVDIVTIGICFGLAIIGLCCFDPAPTRD